jgi:purine catabolism regulator
VLNWGIGGFYPDVLDLYKAYSEARLAAAIGRLVGEPGALNHYEDMGVYRLLHQFPDPGRLQEFACDVLRPVLDYDTRHKGKLLAAIEKYLACERNLALTSRELGLHYNTAKYRVQKADDLLSGALRNPHRRLELELAIKALKLH